jgi:hypothetical protein
MIRGAMAALVFFIVMLAVIVTTIFLCLLIFPLQALFVKFKGGHDAYTYKTDR